MLWKSMVVVGAANLSGSLAGAAAREAGLSPIGQFLAALGVNIGVGYLAFKWVTGK